MNVPDPGEILMVWVGENLGHFRIVSRYAHDHGYSQLWRLQSNKSGEFLWLKCHQYSGKWAGEVNALTHWTPVLQIQAPRIVAYRVEPLAVLMTEMSGMMASAAHLEHKCEKTLWQEAGAYLARLHTLENDWLGSTNLDGTPAGDKNDDPVHSVRQSIESRLTQGTEQGLFDAAEREFIAYGAKEWTAALKEERPRAIHRDYSPRNWLTNATGHLTGVIDFEHARWDVRAADLNRWWDKEFVTKPYLAEAFFDGYAGRMPDEKQWGQIQALRLLGAVSGIVWATGVGDEPFAQLNREALHRLM